MRSLSLCLSIFPCISFAGPRPPMIDEVRITEVSPSPAFVPEWIELEHTGIEEVSLANCLIEVGWAVTHSDQLPDVVMKPGDIWVLGADVFPAYCSMRVDLLVPSLSMKARGPERIRLVCPSFEEPEAASLVISEVVFDFGAAHGKRGRTLSRCRNLANSVEGLEEGWGIDGAPAWCETPVGEERGSPGWRSECDVPKQVGAVGLGCSADVNTSYDTVWYFSLTVAMVLVGRTRRHFLYSERYGSQKNRTFG